MSKKQLDDETLKGWWSLAKRGKGGFFVKDNILYHVEDFGPKFFSAVFAKG